MSYFVVCTFDLKNASWTDYQTAYADLANIGLHKTVVSGQGKNVMAPTTMTMGVQWCRRILDPRLRPGSGSRRVLCAQFSSEIFVVVAGNWAWKGHFNMGGPRHA